MVNIYKCLEILLHDDGVPSVHVCLCDDESKNKHYTLNNKCKWIKLSFSIIVRHLDAEHGTEKSRKRPRKIITHKDYIKCSNVHRDNNIKIYISKTTIGTKTKPHQNNNKTIRLRTRVSYVS